MLNMERKESRSTMVVMQSNSSVYSDDDGLSRKSGDCGIFDFGDTSSIGFMELLGIQDFSNNISSIFLDMHSPAAAPTKSSVSEVLNSPATPNSSSISSESTAAATAIPTSIANHQQQNKPTKQHRLKKVKKEGSGNSSSSDEQQKEKMPKQKKKVDKQKRVAFMTKSEVDHLEDGYKWRKYGQKAVKNSPFPRSYYRCTNTSCIVKKRVERSYKDPSLVVTTYQGQHTHPITTQIPPLSSSSSLFQYINNNNYYLHPSSTTTPPSLHNHYDNVINCTTPVPIDPITTMHDGNCYSSNFALSSSSNFLGESHGLLQDILPTSIIAHHHH